MKSKEILIIWIPIILAISMAAFLVGKNLNLREENLISQIPYVPEQEEIAKTKKQQDPQKTLRKKQKKIKIKGIIDINGKKMVIINDFIFKKGDRIDSFKITEIDRNYIILVSQKNKIKLRVGDEFEIL